ncbi:MAG: hypothetical protein ACI9BF_000758, partial [Candidatus Paceibacteria bacterium]
DSSVIEVTEAESVSGSFMISKIGNISRDPLQIFLREGDDYRQIAVASNKDFETSSLQEGEYVAVLLYETLFLQVEAEPFWKRLIDTLFLPTIAYAFFQDYTEVVAIPFTVEYDVVEPEPTGASSVLFLPGIMGSRLYETGSECGSEVSEQERWFSFDECDQLRFKTRFDGKSINDIYTKATDNAVIENAAVINPLYQSFFDKMNELEEAKVIADFTPFAYDWRLRLDDLLKMKEDLVTHEVRYDVTTILSESNIYKTLQKMAEDSYSGKVTLVAHSNGGLLVRTFLGALQVANDPLLNKIDNVILVASPQVGTPDAVVGMLHGSVIGPGGLVVSQEVVRTILNTAPFGHHLLPNKDYFAGAGVSISTPVITFNEGSVTDVWRNTFGKEITTNEKLHQFLSKDSARVKPAIDDLLHPEVVDNNLLNYADIVPGLTNVWTPSTSTKVYQIAGTGIETVSGITYFTDKECIKGGHLWFKCSEYKEKLGYYVNHTFDGDETVVVPSALAMSEEGSVERWWLDLGKFKKEIDTNRVHKNIFEVPDVINFVSDVISTSSPQTYDYLSAEVVTPEIGQRLNFTLHSPLDMYMESSQGVVSSTTNDIQGATYRRYGEVQYISLPSDTTGLTLRLRGYKSGSFTLVIEEWEDGIKIDTMDYKAIPSGTSTDVFLDLESLSDETELKIDFDGDGDIDGVVLASVDVVVVPAVSSVEKTITDSKSTTGTRVKKDLPEGVVAGVSVDNSEEWYYGELMRLLRELSIALGKLQKLR